eukprot:TRINITY_DN33105_c0_g1_i4.p1 TRINITY_DN33105_c0_g1~~TRINITY_DN33105_c0_g1_i4.p1  ORF type:complete len:317 (-),score=70.45 TRINITY_DN33105_c0_g1_i4:248-1198(-)
MAVAAQRLRRLSSQALAALETQPAQPTTVSALSSSLRLKPRSCASSSSAAVATNAGELPKLYLGTMTFGWNQASSAVDLEVASGFVQKFLAAGGVEIDTARIYSGGETEIILGKVLKDLERRSYVLATKVHPSQPGGLSEKGIRGQLQASLANLGVEKADVLYLHQPDPENDLTESLRCIDSLIKEGQVGALGLSNYSAVETERLCELCREHGWAAPSFYQGLYNPLNRRVETTLLPVLRKYGVSFIAFNPLAAGMLTGKHRFGTDVLDGRFKNNPNQRGHRSTASPWSRQHTRGCCGIPHWTRAWEMAFYSGLRA